MPVGPGEKEQGREGGGASPGETKHGKQVLLNGLPSPCRDGAMAVPRRRTLSQPRPATHRRRRQVCPTHTQKSEPRVPAKSLSSEAISPVSCGSGCAMRISPTTLNTKPVPEAPDRTLRGGTSARSTRTRRMTTNRPHRIPRRLQKVPQNRQSTKMDREMRGGGGPVQMVPYSLAKGVFTGPVQRC